MSRADPAAAIFSPTACIQTTRLYALKRRRMLCLLFTATFTHCGGERDVMPHRQAQPLVLQAGGQASLVPSTS